MKTLVIAALIVLATTAERASVAAQDLRGFATGGVTSDVNDQRFPSAGGGVVVNVGRPWLSIGAQGETFWQWPYFAGRGTVFGQGNLLSTRRIRPFLLAGFGFGESEGPMLGGGVEIRQPNRRLGLRVSVEDYLSNVTGINCGLYGVESNCKSSVRHQVALRVGVLF